LRFIIVAAVLSGALCGVPQGAKGKYYGHKLFAVHPETEEQVKWMQQVREQDTQESVDFWTDPLLDTDVYIRVVPETEQELRDTMDSLSLKYEVKVENLQTLVDFEASAPSAVSGSHAAVGKYVKSFQIYNFIYDLGRDYPKLVTYESIGQSFQGKQLFVTKYSTGPNRPAIFINSGMHSREWIAHATIVWIMNEFATKYGKDKEITAFLDKFDVYLMPLANPDGYDYSHNGERFWRKTMSDYGSKRCIGADPNRNFDSNFGGEGTSTNPCSDIYHGVRAFSEPEVAALAKFVGSIPNLYMYMDVHAFTQIWMTPFGYKHERPKDYQEVDRVANIGAKALMGVNGSRFRVGTPISLLYAASGGSFDYMKEVLGIKYAFAMELRPESGGIWGFVVPPAEIPDSGRETMAGIMAAANAMKL